MKFFNFLTDKVSKFFILKQLLNNQYSFIALIITYYLISPEKIMNKSKEIWNKLVSLYNKMNNQEKNNTNNSEEKKEDLEKKNVTFNTEEENKVNNFSETNNIPIKKNIRNIIKKKENNPYKNDKDMLDSNYNNSPGNYEYKININSNICATPIFTLRTYEDIDFYHNFILHKFDTQKIYNLNMVKDINKWMTSSYLSNEDLSNEFTPIYFIYKDSNSVDIQVYEYLKFFVSTNQEGIKNGFIQKGNDYLIIKNYIDQLIEKNYIQDLLNGENYINYNLSTNEDTVKFLEKFLSLVLIPEEKLGNELTFDISNYHENKNVYEYFMKTLNSDINLFSTSI